MTNEHKDPFLAALGITAQDQIQALLVKADGAIVWRASGRLDANQEASLREFIARWLASNPT